MHPPPGGVQHGWADVNGVRLHYVSAGQGDLILFVHGFPEFWYAWKDQLAEFGRDYRAVAVDMRGYNLSSKPAEVDAYRVPALVEDLRALVDHLGHQRFVLVAHDWGGVVAWAFAMTHPERLSRLVIINAPHPVIFRRELASNPAQQAASRYIATFRTPQAEAILSADGNAVLERMVLGDGLARGYISPADQAEYQKAWSEPGALTGGLNWYRAMDQGTLEPRVIEVPTLVLWGMRDTALLPGNLDGLDQYVRHLTIERVADADHWVVHQRPDLVNATIRHFLGG